MFTQNGYLLHTLRHLVRPDTNTLEDVVTPLYLGPPVRVIRDFLTLDLVENEVGSCRCCHNDEVRINQDRCSPNDKDEVQRG